MANGSQSSVISSQSEVGGRTPSAVPTRPRSATSADGSSVSCSSFEVVYRREEPEQASKSPLFCVACETVQRDGVRRPELRYLHADDTGHAERKFRQGHTREILQGIIHIVAVGPVIGYHVHDNHGERLSA